MVTKELSLSRIAGPFKLPPFPDLVISPLGMVPKKETGKFRLIHDLSFPHCLSVNSFISDESASVQYESLDKIVHLVQSFGPNCLMAKCDIEEAFRIIPIAPQDRHLLGFTFDDKFFFDKCLPMGCRSSCAIFETFSKALQWVAIHKLQVSGISHILDDFIFVGPPNCQKVSHDLNSFLDFCSVTGIPIKHSKTVQPSTSIIAHGIKVDSASMQISLPQDKLSNCMSLLSQFQHKKKIQLRQLQSIIGLLNFACRVVRPGRAFLRRLIDLTKGVTHSHHYIRLNAQGRADIRAWLSFLQEHNGVSMFLEAQWTHSEAIKLFSDASGAIGFAAVFGPKWLCASWPSNLVNTHITTKELFPIVLSIEIWGLHLSNKKVLFKCDNSAVVHIINNQTSKDAVTMSLVRRLVLASLRFNILFRAVHIPGRSNIIPDKLSRFQFQEARKLAPWLEPTPTKIPATLFTLA